jgi:hypothetical protein
MVKSTDGISFSPVSNITVRKGVNLDINGDGYEDLVIEGGNTSFTTGVVYVFLSGGSSGVPVGTIAGASTVLTGPGDFGFGGSVTVGDVNGDGYADVVVGALFPGNSAWQAFVFQSSGPSGVPNGDSTTANTKLSGIVLNTNSAPALAVGDVNGDGYGDVAVGASGSGVFVFSGGVSGVASASSSGAQVKLTGAGTSSFGSSVALGDVNGDGFADVIVGSVSD